MRMGHLVAACIAMSSSAALASTKDMALCGHLADAWKTAFDKKDAASVAAMYDPAEGLYSNPFWTATGRAGIEGGLKADFALDANFSNITCDAAERDGSLLVARGTFVASARGPGGKTLPMNGHWFATARDVGGGKYLMMTHNANFQLPPSK